MTSVSTAGEEAVDASIPLTGNSFVISDMEMDDVGSGEVLGEIFGTQNGINIDGAECIAIAIEIMVTISGDMATGDLSGSLDCLLEGQGFPVTISGLLTATR